MKVPNVNECLSGWYFLNYRTFLSPNLVLLCSIMSQSVMWKKNCCCCYLQGQSHSEGSYDQNMILSTLYSELLTPWQPNLVWWYIIISQSVLWKKLDYCFQGQGHREGSKCSCLSKWCLLTHQTFCFQTWYCDALLWVRVSCKKIDLPLSRSRSLQELTWSKCDNFYCIFWTADPFATKLGLIVHYHKLECFMEKLDCCVQSQGHSKISKYLWIFVQMIFSESLSLFATKLCMVMHHYEQDCLSKRLVCFLQDQGHS